MNKWWMQHGCAKKSDLVERIRSLTAAAPRTLEKEEFDWIMPVLARHYDFEGKGGHTATRIDVVWTAPYGQKPTRCMLLVQPDGSSQDISWHVAISPEGKPSAKSTRRLAMRCELSAQIDSWMRHHPKEDHVCGFCGGVLEGVVEVDHYPEPFWSLAQRFEDLHGVNDNVQDGEQIGTAMFTDREYAGLWDMFHEEHAQLRWAHKKCNNSGRAR